MKPLRHHPSQTALSREVIDTLFANFYRKYGKDTMEVRHPLGLFVRIEWACIWNRVSNVGKTGTIIATNDKYCVVQITSGAVKNRVTDVYRCEDVVNAAQRIIKTLPV